MRHRLLIPTCLGASALLVCAPATARPSPPCHDFSFPVYFAKGSAELSDPARRVLVAAGPRLGSCRIARVAVATRDHPGTAALEAARGKVVAEALVAAGAPAEVTQVVKRRHPLNFLQRRVTVAVQMSRP